MENDCVLKIEHLTKRFTGIVANDDISLEIGRKEIHALCGENGAGKSTFCKMLTGVYHPDEGRIFVNGEEKRFASPSESLKAGIGMVYQERNLVGFLTGAQNICLGNEPLHGGLIDEKSILKNAEEIREQLGIDINLNVPVNTLGAGGQQIIEIIRALYRKPSVLILDEPTASLGEGEVEPFLNFICDLKNRMGLSIIFISHKIDELFKIADTITILTEGKVILTSPTQKLTKQECINAMIRSDRIQKIDVPEKNFSKAKEVLKTDTISFENKEHKIPMTIHEGEAVGFYGLVGSGRTECMEAIAGIRLSDKLGFTFNGKTVEKTDSIEMIRNGLILTPEKRQNGAFRGLSLVENVSNLFIDKLSDKFGFFNFKEAYQLAEKVLKKNKVKYADVNQSIVELSGGNIQKVIIGRSIEIDNLKLLIMDEPTAGMDLGAKSEIYKSIRYLVDEENKSVIFISSELDELITCCDKICVFAQGDIVSEFARKNFDRNAILTTAISKKGVAENE